MKLLLHLNNIVTKVTSFMYTELTIIVATQTNLRFFSKWEQKRQEWQLTWTGMESPIWETNFAFLMENEKGIVDLEH